MNEVLTYSWIAIGILLILIVIAAGLIWVERRMLVFWQDRYGPDRTGPFGTLQVVADMIKMIFKEDWMSKFAEKKVFVQAPTTVIISILMSFAIIPFTPAQVAVQIQRWFTVFCGHVFSWWIWGGVR